MKAIIVPDLAYTSHKGRRGGSSNGYKEMSARLKYLQYRDDADGHIPQEQGLERCASGMAAASTAGLIVATGYCYWFAGSSLALPHPRRNRAIAASAGQS